MEEEFPPSPLPQGNVLVNVSNCNNTLTEESTLERCYSSFWPYQVERPKGCDLFDFLSSNASWHTVLTHKQQKCGRGQKSWCLASFFFSDIKKLLVFHSWMSVWLKCQAEILMLLCSFTDLRSHFKWFRFYKALCKIMFILLCVLIIYCFLHYCVLFLHVRL